MKRKSRTPYHSPNTDINSSACSQEEENEQTAKEKASNGQKSLNPRHWWQKDEKWQWKPNSKQIESMQGQEIIPRQQGNAERKIEYIRSELSRIDEAWRYFQAKEDWRGPQALIKSRRLWIESSCAKKQDRSFKDMKDLDEE